MSKKIVVIGSLNMDIVISANRPPKIGETMFGDNVTYLSGGKGANQAVAVQKLGGNIDMIGVVGDDVFGKTILDKLNSYGLHTTYIKQQTGVATGIANIVHLPEDNSIIVIPGANAHCSEELVAEMESVIAEADVLLLQLEIPQEAVFSALKIAKKHHVTTIVNPAPAKELSSEFLSLVDFITPNQTELESILGVTIESTHDLEQAFNKWNATYQSHLIVTLGAEGVAIWQDEKVKVIPAKRLGDVVDTTGAGDSFNAALAYGIAEAWPMEKTIQFATTVAGLAVTMFGAQEGMPTYQEVLAVIDL
ncbi:ribokinase [Radiobacillus sp. PE A8.2]|uniref:ribokinase n=1 Tax=Radiobacillus sp. PE A8.2 TaxID=3380349 RepID=UPI00388F7DBE